VIRDTLAIARSYHTGRTGVREIAFALAQDGSQALLLSRLREAAARGGVPFVGALVRRLQTSVYGLEIGRDVTLGEGVLFMHPLGVVIGGDTRVGDRVVFLGSNTVGNVSNKGYPVIDNDVVIGAGARILGPVHIGAGAQIGANAVVLRDVPAGALALGVPAVVRLPEKNES
jgi:serine O-acetyltransferase